MSAPWYRRLADGLAKSRDHLGEQLNLLLERGPDLDERFWSDLEDVLMASDAGVIAAAEMTATLRTDASRLALPDARAVLDRLVGTIAEEFPPNPDLFAEAPVVVLFVGVNGTGKTTSVGKLAKRLADEGKSVILGSADTFRAAASEQLDIWAMRAGVPVVRRDRGADAASVAYETVERAQELNCDVVLIDTAGRLHTSPDLMRELQKVKRVVDARSTAPVRTVLVLDATTGQNGLIQAREFHAAMGLDGVILTKLDGTSKGGIAVAVAKELSVPVIAVGVGEAVDDLRDFDPNDYARALITGE